MIKIAICDDVYIFIKSIKNYLLQYSRETSNPMIIRHFVNGLILLESLKNTKYDIIFLDLMMPSIDGFEVAKNIRLVNDSVQIIFTTNYFNVLNAMKGYAYNANGFLSKQDLSYNKIKDLMDKFYLKRVKNPESRILIKNDFGIYNVDSSDVVYLETYKKNILIHCINEVIVCYENLKYYEDKLNLPCFFRCHNSYIVNLNYVNTIQTNYAIVTNNIKVPISKYRKREFMKHLAFYIGESP